MKTGFLLITILTSLGQQEVRYTGGFGTYEECMADGENLFSQMLADDKLKTYGLVAYHCVEGRWAFPMKGQK